MSREPKRKALIIAISEYNVKLFTPLEFCNNDAEKMYELLRSLRYEISDNHNLIGYVEFDKIRAPSETLSCIKYLIFLVVYRKPSIWLANSFL